MDYRERNSLVYSYLIKMGFKPEIKELKVADYLIGNIAIERKTVSDFISSIINGRLIKQIEELKQFEKKLLVIEGISEQELYSEDNFRINPNAIRGFLLSVVLKHKIPIIYTKDSEDTAKFIDVLSKKKT
ncbi:MAG: ERCC4 domain-containing protein, partial [bacterium]